MTKKSKELVPPGLTFIADNIVSKQNILGGPKAEGAAWAKGLDIPKTGETIFFAGCGYQYVAGLDSLMSLIRKMDKSIIGTELPMGIAGLQKKAGIDLAGIYNKLSAKGGENEGQVLRDAVKVLRALKINFGYLAEEEPCCGGLLHYAGMREEFSANARNAFAKFSQYGVKTIIGIVPSCTYTLSGLMPKYVEGSDIKVKHFSQVVAEGLGSLNLKFPRDVKVTYHDPCQMSRFMKVTDEPRKIIAAIKGLELVETNWTNREWSTCCGGGGGFEAVFPELSEILAGNRAKELADTGARIIITNCPGCIMQIKHGLKKLGKEDIEVMDLAQVVAMALGE
jgi:dimethylglycine catabolism B